MSDKQSKGTERTIPLGEFIQEVCNRSKGGEEAKTEVDSLLNTGVARINIPRKSFLEIVLRAEIAVDGFEIS